jgi:GTP-binding protein Era
VTRAGIAAVIGRPNVGKSTLVNALVGQKVSIVTDKPQTTRGMIRGILTREDVQIVLVDTPGFHKPRTLLGERLNRVVGDSSGDADVVVQVVDAAAGVGRGDAYVAADRVAPFPRMKVCAVNKVDLLRADAIPAQLEAASRLAGFDHVLPLSARTGRGLDEVVGVLAAAMPMGPWLFPPDEVTDRPLELRVADVVREKALALTRDELPHSIAVRVEELTRETGLVRISCLVLVERESQKGIVIGHGGSMLKRMGTLARRELEAILESRVFLELRVKVQREWQRDPAALTRLGY